MFRVFVQQWTLYTIYTYKIWSWSWKAREVEVNGAFCEGSGYNVGLVIKEHTYEKYINRLEAARDGMVGCGLWDVWRWVTGWPNQSLLSFIFIYVCFVGWLGLFLFVVFTAHSVLNIVRMIFIYTNNNNNDHNTLSSKGVYKSNISDIWILHKAVCFWERENGLILRVVLVFGLPFLFALFLSVL